MRQFLALTRRDWFDQSLCLRVYEHEMFCEPNRLAEARAVCAECPVQQECFDWAKETGQEWCVAAGIQFTHGIKRLISNPTQKVKHMTTVRILTTINTGYGATGDEVELPVKVAEQFIAVGWAELTGGQTLDVDPETTEDDTDEGDEDPAVDEPEVPQEAPVAAGIQFVDEVPPVK